MGYIGTSTVSKWQRLAAAVASLVGVVGVNSYKMAVNGYEMAITRYETGRQHL